MSQQSVAATAAIPLTRRVDFLLTLEALEACRPRALGVVALVDLRVGITQLDRNVSLQLVLETDSLDLGDSLNDRRLAVSDVTDGANVDCGLARNNFGGQRSQRGQVQSLRIRLLGQLWPLGLGRRNRLLHRRLQRLGLLVEGLLLFDVIVTVRIEHGGSRLGLVVREVAVGSHNC